jgi:hypothetical protein
VDIVKVDPKEISRVAGKRIYLVQNRDEWLTLVNTTAKLQIPQIIVFCQWNIIHHSLTICTATHPIR